MSAVSGTVGFFLLLRALAILSGVHGQRVVVPQGIAAVNGSSTDMGCSGVEQSGSHTICNCSYLNDGVSPDIDTSSSDWASQLVTVRRDPGNPIIDYPHVLLTFAFDTPVSPTGIEIDLFNCPDWKIGATDVTAYFNPQYEPSLNFSRVSSFASANPLPQPSCDSLSTVTLSVQEGNYRTIYILVDLQSSPIEWVHVGEVRFTGINIPNCPQPTTSIPSTTQIFASSSSSSQSQFIPTSSTAFQSSSIETETTTVLSPSVFSTSPTLNTLSSHTPNSVAFTPLLTLSSTKVQSTVIILSTKSSTPLSTKGSNSSSVSPRGNTYPGTTSSKKTINNTATVSVAPPGEEDKPLLDGTTTILAAAIVAAFLILVLLTFVCLIYICVSRRKRQSKKFSRINHLSSNTGSILPSSTNPTQVGFPSPLHEQYSTVSAIAKSDTHYEAFIARHRKDLEGLEYSYAYVSLSEAKTKVRYSAAAKYDYVECGTPTWSLRRPNEHLVPKKVEAPVAPSPLYSNIPYAASPSCVPRLEISDGESFPFSPDEVIISEFINPLDFTCIEEPGQSEDTPKVYGPVYPSLDPLPGSVPPLRVNNDNVLEISEGSGEYGSAVLAVTSGLSLRDLRLSKDNNNRDLSILLALKKLSPEATKDELEAFDREVEFIYRVKHPNIVQFIGVCYEDPTFLMIEYMEEGDLYQFLHRYSEIVPAATTASENQISTHALVHMATQIASGMAYLTSMKFIHRDLATRKCFVGSNFSVKLADFGTNTRYRSHYFRIRGNILMPIRWMATECFYGKFSEKTDVWAFGVTVWELFTLAQEAPYCNLLDEDVVKNALNADGRQYLSRPSACTKPLFELIERCWDVESKERPPFQEIEQTLHKLNKKPF